MIKATMQRMALVCATIVVGAMCAAVAGAQEISYPCHRCGDVELSLPLLLTKSTTLDGTHGSHAELDNGSGVGMSIGYNFNAHFLLNGLFTWSTRGYDATVIQEDGTSSTYNATMYTANFSLNGTYYLLNRDITPFFTAGIGFAGIDTDIPTGVIQSACFWDPWRGYVCGTYEETKTENDMTFNAGLGVRWDISKGISLQGSYNKTWIDRNTGSGGTLDLDLVKLEIIFRTNVREGDAMPSRW